MSDYPSMPEWVDLSGLSERANALMRQNWALLNEAADLLNAGDMTPMAWEQLQDIWAESVDVEAKLRRTRLTDTMVAQATGRER